LQPQSARATFRSAHRDGERVGLVRGGEVLLIPSRLPHSAEAVEDSVVSDSFAPIRSDWVEQRDAYLRR